MAEPIRINEVLEGAEAKIVDLSAKSAAFREKHQLTIAANADERLALVRDDRWRQARIPRRFAGARVEDFADEATREYGLAQRLTAWAEDPTGANLVILGALGAGKTHAAVAAARLRAEAGATVRFHPVVELLDKLRPGGPEHILEELFYVDLLVLDDLGSNRPTEWTGERLYALLNRRSMECLPIIATSNLRGTRAKAPDDYEGPTLDEALGGRGFSRLVGEGATVLQMTGPDLRRAARGPA